VLKEEFIMTNKQFTNLPLTNEMLNNIKSLGYVEMTPIQSKSLPHILQNKDLIVQAKTGSGKTAAFGIGLLSKLNVKKFRIQSLVLCPTRELADQVARELRRLARFAHNIKILTLCGGVPYRPQVHSLSHQAHIIVGTPGRILKHLKEGSFVCDDIDTLVLDEADRMLDMGFNEDINSIISQIPKNRQTLLFSATYPESIKELSADILRNPITVSVESTHDESSIKQYFYKISSQNKTASVPALLSIYKPESVLIFCNTKIQCNELADDLEERNFDVLVLHSDLEQKERNETLVLFSNKSYPILIATDVAARGLDIKDVDMVINYDLANDPEVHIHRIGRTGRAGKSGLAISLYCSEDKDRFEDIKDYSKQSITVDEISSLDGNTNHILKSQWSTLFINGGKKSKVRAGDILGALTANVGLCKDEVGKIDILELCSYVAVKKEVVEKALKGLENGKIKGKYFKIFQK